MMNATLAGLPQLQTAWVHSGALGEVPEPRWHDKQNQKEDTTLPERAKSIPAASSSSAR